MRCIISSQGIAGRDRQAARDCQMTSSAPGPRAWAARRKECGPRSMLRTRAGGRPTGLLPGMTRTSNRGLPPASGPGPSLASGSACRQETGGKTLVTLSRDRHPPGPARMPLRARRADSSSLDDRPVPIFASIGASIARQKERAAGEVTPAALQGEMPPRGRCVASPSIIAFPWGVFACGNPQFLV